MEFTCLGLGTSDGGPSCHLLQLSGLHILLECPLDMAVLQFFLPSALPATPSSGKRPADVPPCSLAGQKAPKLDADRVTGIPREIQVCDDLIHTSCGHSFLNVEPWYKTAEFGLLDVSSIDVVLISNPDGMLGLPFLTSMPEFSGKVYATGPTAKLGELMMEEIVSMHGEYIQSFGRSDETLPYWLEPKILERLPMITKKALVDDDGVGRANWHSLYRKKDIVTCMRKVQPLHYEEEVNIFDCLRVKPCSSGSEIGGSNWIIYGARCLSYFSASKLMPGHAMGLNLSSHAQSDVLLFCDLKSCCNNVLVRGTSVEQNACSQITKTILNRSNLESKIASAMQMIGTDTCILEKTNLPGRVTEITTTDHLPSVSRAALDAVIDGGCVLVTISGIGASLELMEALSQELTVSKMRQVPMFYISPMAEEVLVYTNTVPEWLCAARQEKLYAGLDLFGHVELLKEKRLHQISALHSPKTINVWKEPCIVFASHWSLRMGPVVHLLHKWRQNPCCLLILTETVADINFALAPFKPISMKLLEYESGRKLRSEEVATIIEKLQPMCCLLPEVMQAEFQQLCTERASTVGDFNQFYSVWDILNISKPPWVEVDMSADLACLFRPKQLDSERAADRMTMSLRRKGGRWSLGLQPSSDIQKGSSSLSARDDVCWGSIDGIKLVTSLKDAGLACELRLGAEDEGSDRSACIIVKSPSFARVDLKENSTLIETNDPSVRQIVTDVVKKLLQFM